jgi:hypothetical protein
VSQHGQNAATEHTQRLRQAQASCSWPFFNMLERLRDNVARQERRHFYCHLISHTFSVV